MVNGLAADNIELKAKIQDLNKRIERFDNFQEKNKWFFDRLEAEAEFLKKEQRFKEEEIAEQERRAQEIFEEETKPLTEEEKARIRRIKEEKRKTS